MSIAKHYQTGETLPENVYKKLLAARTFRAGSLSLRQVRTSYQIAYVHMYHRGSVRNTFHLIYSCLVSS